MPWRDVQSLNIFAPVDEHYNENWVEQILGTIIKPIFDQHHHNLRWLWVTRYVNEYDENNPPTGTEIPEEYITNGYYRYIWFRTSIVQDLKEQLHDNFIELANDAGCFIHPNGWMEYDVLNDLGGDRFIYSEASDSERINRAQKVAFFMDATVRLMIDMLVEKEPGLWEFEINEHRQNHNGSLFESVHHLFCNATQASTTVLLSIQNGQLGVRTFWMKQLTIPIDEQENWPIQVRLSY